MAVTLTHPEAERAVLAAILLTGDELYRAGYLADLSPDDFSTPAHRAIYRAMHELHGDEEPIDMRTVQARLEAAGQLDLVGGVAYLSALELDLPEIGHSEAYVRLIREAAIRRGLTVELRRAAQSLEDGSAALSDVLSAGHVALRRADVRIATEALVPVGETFQEALEAAQNPRPSGLVGVTTGYRKLDGMTLGWQPGQLVIVAARPGRGKTALAACMATEAARAGTPALFCSLEMGQYDLGNRILCAETQLSYESIRTGRLTSAQSTVLHEAADDLRSLPLYIVDLPHLTPGRLAALIRRAMHRHGVRLVFVDYLGLMAADERAENRNLQLASISRALKQTAKECELPIIALHQLNRESERTPGSRPTLAQLRDSGAIEQDADVVILIHRDEAEQTAELIVAKHRNGMTGTVSVTPLLQWFRFADQRRPEPNPQGYLYSGEAIL